MYSASHKLKKLKKRRKRRLFSAVTFLFVIAAGLLIFRTPVFLQNIGEIFKSAGAGLSSTSLPGEPVSDAVLRGTIYDRNFQELAVSYNFFSLYANPAKIDNHAVIAEKLVPVTGSTSEELLASLGEAKRVVQLAGNLDAVQAENIRVLSVEGLFLRESEQRFYPRHTSAVHVVGYTSDGIGLAGMEGRFDLLLQPGKYQSYMVPDLDFQEYSVLGRKGTDLVLTMDIDLQEKIDRYLLDIMAERNADSAMALLLDPWTGRVLSLSSLPSFDANHFWIASEKQRENRVFSQVFSYDLVRPILTRAAAAMQKGVQREPLLPITVAAIDFGLGEEDINRAAVDLSFGESVYGGVLPDKKLAGQVFEHGNDDFISLAQIGVGMASLVNGGWRLTPVFLDSVYDVEKKKSFPLNRQAVFRKLVVSPVQGVVLRRQLLPASEEKGMVAFSGRDIRIIPAGMFSRYIKQDFFGGIIRGDGRTLLLVMAVEQNNLAPFALQEGKKEKKSMDKHGRSLLVDLYLSEQKEKVVVHPGAVDKDNKARFLISRRIDHVPYAAETERVVSEMPSVVGGSLREGLQALSQHNCRVVVKGSGRIISQYPPPRQRLQEGEVCVLSLEASI